MMLVVMDFGHRIEAARVKWVALGYSLDSQPDSGDQSVLINCLMGILRAGRIKPAVRS